MTTLTGEYSGEAIAKLGKRRLNCREVIETLAGVMLVEGVQTHPLRQWAGDEGL
jgi:hypothetical protein